jgi:diguanylate cyclase (GGDEF)-like protein
VETLRRRQELSPWLLMLLFSLFLFPPVMNQYVCVLFVPGYWLDFCRAALWWVYFFPAVHLSGRFGYLGATVTLLASLVVSGYLLLRALQSPGLVQYTFQALLTLAATVFVSVIVGRLSERSSRARESLDEQNANLKALFYSSQFLASSLRQEEILDKCLVLLRASFDFEYADIWLLQDERTLHLAASNIPARVALPQTIPADWDVPGLALAKGEAVFIEDPLHDERVTDKSWVVKLGHSVEAAVPLLHKGEKLGVLMLAGMEKTAFPPEMRERLLTFANQLSLALENARLYRETEQKAVIDEMTGLCNYRYFQEALDRELKRAAREGTMVGLLMMDLDYFKDYNDTFGHQAGDRLLREFGAVLRSAVRETDLAVRYGGDEFAVILPHTDEAGTRQLALRVASQVAEHRFPGCERMPGGRMSLSIGYAVYPTQASEKEHLVSLADDNLYKNKDKKRREKARAYTAQDVRDGA